MAYFHFWWDEVNLEHIADHGVEPYEAEEVIGSRSIINNAGEGKYIAYGQTETGRYLVVVFAKRPKSGLRVVTARDMTEAEKKNLKRRRK
jgi:uncharacterized protein